MSDDPFGRGKEAETDAFGRPVERAPAPSRPAPSDSLWSGHADAPETPVPRPESPARRPEAPAARPEAPAARPEVPSLRPEAPSRRPEALLTTSAFGDEAPSTGALASYGDRAGAAIIDFFVRLAIIVVVTLGAALSGSEDATAAGLLIAVYLIAPLYGPIAMSRMRGQTLGHRAVNTRVVTKSGAPVTGGKAFTREFLVKNVLIEGLGGLFSLGILPLVNYLWPLWDDRNEALHDKMCDTRVVDV